LLNLGIFFRTRHQILIQYLCGFETSTTNQASRAALPVMNDGDPRSVQWRAYKLGRGRNITPNKGHSSDDQIDNQAQVHT